MRRPAARARHLELVRYPGEDVVPQLEPACADPSVHLLGTPSADDRPVDAGPCERPGDGEVGGRGAEVVRDVAKGLDEIEVPLERRLAESGISPPPVVLGESAGALLRKNHDQE